MKNAKLTKIILGVDLGYTYTKNSKGGIFKSCIKEGEAINLNGDKIIVKVNGKTYTMGEGNRTVSLDRTQSDLNLLATFTSIAQAMKTANITDAEIDLVVGLPPANFKELRESYERSLAQTIKTIELNGIKYDITIDRCKCFIQGAGAIYLNPKKYQNATNLIIDIGGFTIDPLYFEENYNLVKYDSLPKGMLTLYANIITAMQERKKIRVSLDEVERAIKKGYFTIQRKRVDIKEFDDVITAYVDDFMTDIEAGFPLDTVENILLVGGGANAIVDKLKKRIPDIAVEENAQFINAISYEAIGKKIFK